MAGWCCRKSSGMGPTLQDQLREKLRAIEYCYPKTHYACVLNHQGAFLGGMSWEERLPHEYEEVCTAVAALKRAATQFAATLDQNDCPVLHIAGETHLFSCYDLGDSVLAFYSQLESLDKLRGNNSSGSNGAGATGNGGSTSGAGGGGNGGGGTSGYMVDTAGADSKLQESVICDLKLLLSGAAVASPGSNHTSPPITTAGTRMI
ncbi:unnamed protein product [Phaeothamnion confervicola]